MSASRFLLKIGYSLLNFFVLPLTILLFLLRSLFKIQFFRVNSSRIGHLALNNDLLLRRIQLDPVQKKVKYIGIAATPIANNQLLRMLQRKLTIIQIPQPKLVRSVTKILAVNSILSKWGLFTNLPYSNQEYYKLFRTTLPNLSFSNGEENEGKQLLKKMNVPSWFICFHARDPTHISKFIRKGDTNFNFRNCDVNNYLQAAEYIAQQGGYALRMGASIEKKITTENQKIIDYASTYRSDFGDIYLPAKCKFFLGNTAGLVNIPRILHVPVALANLIPLIKETPPGKMDLFIPKKIWSSKEKRHLTFEEMINSPLKEIWEKNKFPEEDGLIAIENTAQEILDLAIEMNERLDGNWITTKEDEKLQNKFRSLFKPDCICYGFPSRIGAKFLRENKNLLNEKAEEIG